MYRPEGWDNPYPKTGETLGMWALFEAGADAMLEALRGRINFLLEPDNPDDTIIEDGFGSGWSSTCPRCGFKTMSIVRPGKVQCNFCLKGDVFIPED